MTETWKVVYFLPGDQWSGLNNKGVALVEASNRAEAMSAFQRQYAGKFSTVETCTKLLG